MKFDIERKGYNRKQVDEFVNSVSKQNDGIVEKQKERINELKKEVSILENKIAKYKQKDTNISDALVVAIDTAKKIENSSKNIYELEIKRIRALYNKWDNFLNEMLERYPKLKADFDTQKILKVFDDGINEVLEKNNVEIENKSYEYGGGIRSLINKMSNVSSYSRQDIKNANNPYTIIRNPRPQGYLFDEKEIEDEYFFENERMDKDSMIKPILNLKEDNKSMKGYENVVDKFLDDDLNELDEVAYSQALFNKQKKESGFDLKEALTPTEDLEDIMKSFEIDTNTSKKK